MFFIIRVLGEQQPEWMDRYFQKACVLISLERFEEALSDLKKAQRGLGQTAILLVVSIMLKYICIWCALLFGQGFPFSYIYFTMIATASIHLCWYKRLQNTTCGTDPHDVEDDAPRCNSFFIIGWSSLPTGFLHCSRFFLLQKSANYHRFVQPDFNQPTDGTSPWLRVKQWKQVRCLAPKEACVHFQLGKVPKGDGNLCVFQGSEGLKGESIHPKGCGKRIGKATFWKNLGNW